MITREKVRTLRKMNQEIRYLQDKQNELRYSVQYSSQSLNGVGTKSSNYGNDRMEAFADRIREIDLKIFPLLVESTNLFLEVLNDFDELEVTGNARVTFLEWCEGTEAKKMARKTGISESGVFQIVQRVIDRSESKSTAGETTIKR